MSSDPKPTSLRDLYAKPSSPWNIVPSSGPADPAGSPPSSAPSTKSASPLSGVMNNSGTTAVKVLKWGNSNGGSNGLKASANNSPSSSFGGGSYGAGSHPYRNPVYADTGMVYGDGYTSTGPKIALKALLASAFLQYTTTAIAMPWEVGKVLLQVQWVPKRFEEGEFGLELELEMDEEEDNDELSESSTDDSYFHDPTSPTRQSRLARAKPLQSRKVSNPSGKTPLSPLIIAYGPADGVWGMMKRVGRWRTEGWISLWKGLWTSVTLSLLTSTIQPSILAIMRPVFPLNQSRHFPSLLPLASHIITGVLLSPLDTLRTLQIVHPRPSPSIFTHFTLLSSADASENGSAPITLMTLYTEPTLLYPALLDNTLRPLISLLMPRIIERATGVRIGINIWMYPLCEFVGGVIGLAITIPIETVRRRLQAQLVMHGVAKSKSSLSAPATLAVPDGGGRVASCVHLSPRPYKGIVDCIWRILTEERSGPPVDPSLRRKPGGRRPSIRSPPIASSSAVTTPKVRKGKGKPRTSGGNGSANKRDVRTVFDADSSNGRSGGHRPRMLSEEMRLSERRVSSQYHAQGQDKNAPSLGERVEEGFGRVEQAGEEIEGWIEGVEGTGIGQLYRGFGMGVGALVLVLVLGLITGEEAEGWAEL